MVYGEFPQWQYQLLLALMRYIYCELLYRQVSRSLCADAGTFMTGTSTGKFHVNYALMRDS